MMYALESFILRTDLTLLVTFFSDMVPPLTIVILFNTPSIGCHRLHPERKVHKFPLQIWGSKARRLQI